MSLILGFAMITMIGDQVREVMATVQTGLLTNAKRISRTKYFRYGGENASDNKRCAEIVVT